MLATAPLRLRPGWYIDEVTVVTGAVQTLVANVPESFENGLGDWSVDGGTWEVGVPTSGPNSAYAGTNCAATVLAGDYADDSSGRLVSPAFVVPSADQNPRLRFWQWYDFNEWRGPDFGEVQIKVGTNGWQTLAHYEGTSSGVWSQPSFDLSAYAGQTVQFGFYYESHASYGTVAVAPGWYIDEVTLVTGAIQTLVANVPESFEAGLGDWSVDGGTWEVGVPTSGPGVAHSGTNCAATVLAGDYGDDGSGRLVSPPFVVPSADQNPRLRFWHWYDFNEWRGPDFGEVQIKVGTNGWQTLAHYEGTSSGVWRPLFDLSAYTGQTVQVGFYFESHASYGTVAVAPGWYIDDITLVTGAIQTLAANVPRVSKREWATGPWMGSLGKWGCRPADPTAPMRGATARRRYWGATMRTTPAAAWPARRLWCRRRTKIPGCAFGNGMTSTNGAGLISERFRSR